MAGEKRESPEQEIQRLKRELAFAQKKVQIVGSVTRHDILNQMTAIMGYSELVLGMVEDEKLRGFLETGQRAAEKMLRVLAFSKVFQLAGTEPPRWQKLDALICLACDETGFRAVPIRQETGPVSLYAEPGISKVFSYLFDNAVRHGKTTKEIRVRLERGGADPVLIVEDDGVGIAPDEKERIFEHGYGKYTGWGLFVAREILAVNGMTIRETGSPGTGARFEITIPQERIRTG